MDFSISSLISEILNGGSARAMIALLIVAIFILIQEIRTQRKLVETLASKIDLERAEALKVIDTMQARFMDKSEGMLDKYHVALTSQHENTEKIKDMINNLITVISSKN